VKVSIITPSYNQAEFLEHTILSVLGQNYPNLEYFIVDGGSNDGSVEIIEKYSDQLTWWVSEPDGGQAEAINKGFRNATGEIVAWLNSDDMYAPGAITNAVKFFGDNPDIGLVYGNAVSFDKDGYPLNDLVFDDWGLKGLVTFNIICQPAVFFRRDILEQAGYLDENYHMLLDHHLWIRIARKTKIRHNTKVWAFARHHAEAKNVAQAPKFGEEAFKILDWMHTQPDLALIIADNRRSVTAMVHRFNGRYLLDGGLGLPAFKSYIRSFVANPKIAVQEWHRIVFSVLSLLGLGKLAKVFYQAKKITQPASMRAMGIENINTLYAEKRS
jgi:glycosyltransferase involved in cell wall biosynthesis